jgi:hypothetical protein
MLIGCAIASAESHKATALENFLVCVSSKLLAREAARKKDADTS